MKYKVENAKDTLDFKSQEKGVEISLLGYIVFLYIGVLLVLLVKLCIFPISLYIFFYIYSFKKS